MLILKLKQTVFIQKYFFLGSCHPILWSNKFTCLDTGINFKFWLEKKPMACQTNFYFSCLLIIYLKLPMQSVPIGTKVVISNPANGKMYSILHYVIKFFSDRSVSPGTRVSSTNKIDHLDICTGKTMQHTTIHNKISFLQHCRPGLMPSQSLCLLFLSEYWRKKL
jgi:hypothetical protein